MSGRRGFGEERQKSNRKKGGDKRPERAQRRIRFKNVL